MALISILIPVYNIPESYLRRCLESIQNQTLQDIEAVVIDDGSEQWCSDICDQYGEKNSIFRIIHQKNSGLSVSRNNAYYNAHSQWLMFLDGDDWLEADICEKLAGCMEEQTDVDIITFGIIRDTGSVSQRFPMPYLQEQAYCGRECTALRDSILDHENFLSSSCAKLYKKSFIDKFSLIHDAELKGGIEGIEFIFRVLDKARKVLTTPYYGLHYIYNENSMSSKPNDKTNKLVLLGLHKIEKYIDESIADLEVKKMLYQRGVYTVMATATRSYFNPAIKNKRKQKNFHLCSAIFCQNEIK